MRLASCHMLEARRGRTVMTRNFEAMLEAARKVQTTPQQREEQRRSFAYGNTAYENSNITREMIDRQAEELAEQRNG